MRTVRVNVRSMVEDVLKSGDLTRMGGEMGALLTEGAEAHRRIQGQASDEYRSEVPVKLITERDGLRFIFTGRADGLYPDGGIMVLQEIKTTFMALDALTPEDHPRYWAQAICYAHMICERGGLDRMAVELLYAGRDTGGGTRAFRREMTACELAEGFCGVAEPYMRRAAARIGHGDRRDASIGGLAFPFESYRPGQRDMMKHAYFAMTRSQTVFVQAPTGIGKTVAAVFPALKAIAAGKLERVFYLTSQTTVALSAMSLLTQLVSGGLCVMALRLRAKDRACFLRDEPGGPQCDPDICPYAKGYYDRVDAALEEISLSPKCYDGAQIDEIALMHTVCPFELALDAALMCDVIVCDYNYAFDPKVYLRRFFTTKGRHALLIDEAHMLPDRSRMMYSAELGAKQFIQLRRALNAQNQKKGVLYGATARVAKAFAELSPDGGALSQLAPEGLIADVRDWLDAARAVMPFFGPQAGLMTDIYFAASQFSQIAAKYDMRYRTVVKGGKTSRNVALLCMDASPELKNIYRKCCGALLFSATLWPMDYYKQACGGDEDDAHAVLPSPFPRDNLFVCNVPLKAGYRQREASAGIAADALLSLCQARVGNYMAFFPSYAYLGLVCDQIEKRCHDVEVMRQERELSQQEREDFVLRLRGPLSRSRLALAVLGGAFSQSIDLPGDLLSGAAVISVGLGQINPENDALRDYYEQGGKNGFDYAYRFPGMSKALQAAGRVIRTPADRGVILFIDERYAWEEYARLLPGHFHPMPIIKAERLRGAIERFWREGGYRAERVADNDGGPG